MCERGLFEKEREKKNLLEHFDFLVHFHHVADDWESVKFNIFLRIRIRIK